MNNLSANKKAFSLVEILIVVTILGILLLISLPNFVSTADRVRRDTCINNLRQIQLAKERWALEYNKGADDQPTAANLDGYIKDGTAALWCPLDSTKTFGNSYNINKVKNNPTCKKSADHSL